MIEVKDVNETLWLLQPNLIKSARKKKDGTCTIKYKGNTIFEIFISLHAFNKLRKDIAQYNAW